MVVELEATRDSGTSRDSDTGSGLATHYSSLRECDSSLGRAQATFTSIALDLRLLAFLAYAQATYLPYSNNCRAVSHWTKLSCTRVLDFLLQGLCATRKTSRMQPMAPPTSSMVVLLLSLTLLAFAGAAQATADSLPSYHFGAPISVECLNRSS